MRPGWTVDWSVFIMFRAFNFVHVSSFPRNAALRWYPVVPVYMCFTCSRRIASVETPMGWRMQILAIASHAYSSQEHSPPSWFSWRFSLSTQPCLYALMSVTRFFIHMRIQFVIIQPNVYLCGACEYKLMFIMYATHAKYPIQCHAHFVL